MWIGSRSAVGWALGRMVVVWALMLLAGGGAAGAQDLVRIVNRWKTDSTLHVAATGLAAGSVEPGWPGEVWAMMPVEETGFYRMLNQGTGTYLHTQNQRLEVGEIESGWWSAMWSIEPVEGTDFLRIRNRWLDQFVHLQNPTVELGAVEPGWWSAMWVFEAMVPDEAPQAGGFSYELRGESMADGQLRQAILEQVLVAFSIAGDCELESIESIETSVEKVDRDAGGSVAGAVERWVASGCGATLPYRVTSTVSPQGGVDFSVSAWE